MLSFRYFPLPLANHPASTLANHLAYLQIPYRRSKAANLYSYAFPSSFVLSQQLHEYYIYPKH